MLILFLLYVWILSYGFIDSYLQWQQEPMLSLKQKINFIRMVYNKFPRDSYRANQPLQQCLENFNSEKLFYTTGVEETGFKYTCSSSGILYTVNLDLDQDLQKKGIPELQKKQNLYQNSSLTNLSADFKCDNSYLKFQPKSFQISHF